MLPTKETLDKLECARNFLDDNHITCSRTECACPRYPTLWGCEDCLALYEWKLTSEQLDLLDLAWYNPCPCRAEELGLLGPGEAITLLDNVIDEIREELSHV
jgi:hypothetical protein